MNPNFFSSKAYYFFVVLYKLIVVNALFIGFNIIGVGVLSFMPALIAMFVIVQTIQKEEEYPLLKSFWNVFQKEYLKSQLLFIILLLIGAILFFNYSFFLQNFTNNLFYIGFWITIVAIFFYLFTWIHVVLVYIYFPYLNPLKIIKYSFMLSIVFPFRTILILFIQGALVLLVLFIQALTPIYMVMIFAVTAYLTLLIFRSKYQGLVKDKLPLSLENYQ